MLFGRKNMKKLSYLLCTLFAAGFNTSGAFADYCEIVNISYNFPTIVICQDKCSKKRSKKQKKHQKDNVIDIPILGEAEKKDDSCTFLSCGIHNNVHVDFAGLHSRQGRGIRAGRH